MKVHSACLCGLLICSLVAGLILYATVQIEPETSWSSFIEEILRDEGVDDTESCLRWAFGADYKQLEQRELDDKWRQRHSDLFIVTGTDEIGESIKRIAKTWLDTEPNDPHDSMIICDKCPHIEKWFEEPNEPEEKKRYFCTKCNNEIPYLAIMEKYRDYVPIESEIHICTPEPNEPRVAE